MWHSGHLAKTCLLWGYPKLHFFRIFAYCVYVENSSHGWMSFEFISVIIFQEHHIPTLWRNLIFVSVSYSLFSIRNQNWKKLLLFTNKYHLVISFSWSLSCLRFWVSTELKYIIIARLFLLLTRWRTPYWNECDNLKKKEKDVAISCKKDKTRN